MSAHNYLAKKNSHGSWKSFLQELHIYYTSLACCSRETTTNPGASWIKRSVDLSTLHCSHTSPRTKMPHCFSVHHLTAPSQGRVGHISEVRKQGSEGNPSGHTGQPWFLSWTSKPQANVRWPTYVLCGVCDVWVSEPPPAVKWHGAAYNGAEAGADLSPSHCLGRCHSTMPARLLLPKLPSGGEFKVKL